MRGKHLALAAVAIVVIGLAVSATVWLRRVDYPRVTVESLRARDLEAIVSASGKIQPRRQVNVSANTVGRVTRLAVEEGQRVRAGQFLLEIDPRSLEGQLQRGEASVAAARSSLEQSRTAVDQARTALDLARQNLKRQSDLWSGGLTTREALERAQNDVALREADVRAREQEVRTREEQIRQEQASLTTTKYNLSQVIISAPMAGLVTRRNIEEGETVVVGTMNNAGTVLLTIADMSIIGAEVEVDETAVPEVKIGQPARVTIDAVPDRTFNGRVTEIGNSPIQSATSAADATAARGTNFRVVVTLDQEIPDVKPGFTCTADITTATRTNVLSVPIQALTVRELLYDAKGTLVREPPPPQPNRFRTFMRRQAETTPTIPEPPPGHERRETEGVFVLRDNRAVFVPVKVGIAGERYFEVLSGLTANDRVITGPFSSVRELADGTEVRVQEPHEPTVMFLESVVLALSALWTNKLRSFMTVIGNVVAVASIVTVVSLIQGMNSMVSTAIVSDVGADAFTIQRLPPIRTVEDEERTRGNPPVTLQEAAAIRRFSPTVRAVMAQAQRRGNVSYRDITLENVQIQGVTGSYLEFETFDAERGRVMTSSEVDRNRPVALLGWDVADQLFGDISPLEKVIQIEGIHFRVVGVSARKGGLFGASMDGFAVIPLGMHTRIFGARQSLSLMVKPTTPALLPVAIDDATVAMRVTRRLKPSEPDNFGTYTSDTLFGLYEQATRGIFAVLVGVVALSLLVGGIVIMNIMLMVVSERTREIGLRKALGARRKDILLQVLTESITLSVVGGLLGLLIGFGASRLIAAFTPLPARLEPWSVVLGVGITAGVGLFFGAFPASRAAHLDPIEALRRE
jgi:RND family efflux transporter MFP subunit